MSHLFLNGYLLHVELF